MFNSFMLFIKGFVLGATFMIPGVSGAIIAIMLGMYDKLIIAVSNLRKDFKSNATYLIPIGLGSIIGLFGMASVVTILVDSLGVYMMYFLIGSILGSIPIMVKMSEVKTIEIKYFIYVLLGVLVVLALNFLPEAEYEADSLTIMFIIIGGLFIALAIILPGLSTFAILAALGIFEATMEAIANFDTSFLIPLGISTAVWIMLTIKILEKSMIKYPSITYLIIAGFMVGSIIEVYVSIIEDYPSESLTFFGVALAIFSVILGIVVTIFFTILANKKEKTNDLGGIRNESRTNNEL